MDELINNEDYKTFSKLKERGLVVTSVNCNNSNCKRFGESLNLILRKRDSNSTKKILSWRCSTCGKYRSPYESSFFSLFRKRPQIVLAIIKCWASQLTVTKTISSMELILNEKVHSNTVSEIFRLLRNICSVSIDKDNIFWEVRER